MEEIEAEEKTSSESDSGSETADTSEGTADTSDEMDDTSDGMDDISSDEIDEFLETLLSPARWMKRSV
jgi:hypothetical protein